MTTVSTSGLVLSFCLVLAWLPGSAGQAQVYAPVGGSVSITLQLPDQNTNIISPSGQTMIQVGFFGEPTVSNQYRNRVTVTNFSGGFGTPSLTFTFSGVQLTDAGSFQCTSTFGGNTQCGPALVVLGRPTLPQLSVSPTPVIAGRDVEMTCSATSTSQPPSPSLVLVYVLKQNGNVITQPRTSSFLIKGVTPQNKGQQFQCVAYELNTVTNRLTGLESGDSEVYVLDPQYPPTGISVSPNVSSYNLQPGEQLQDIQCQAQCNPSCDFLWYRAPDQQAIVAEGRQLSLATVTSDEAGTYVCSATNSLGQKLRPVKVEVQESLGSVTFDPPTDQYGVPEGSEVPAILCQADCVPGCQYSWSKDGQFLYESDGINFGQVGRADAGVYTCRASNHQGTREKTLTINVLYGPGRVTLSPAAVRYDLEENAAILPDITCNAECNPQCDVIWYREGGNAPISRRSLSLGTATRADSGTYQCVVSNSLAQQRGQLVSVQVFYKPETMTFDPKTTSYQVEEGVNLAPITCQADCVPGCTFSWYKDNDLSQPAQDSNLLDFGLADLQDSGQWSCVASNAYGQLQKQLRVDIAYGPKNMTLTPARESYTLTAETGVMPEVTCSARCNPPCHYTWLKNNAPYPAASNASISLGTITTEDEGNYTCRAFNRLGAETKSFQLIVTYGPSRIELRPDQTRYDVTVGASLAVTCSATCDPECDLRWVKDTGMEYSSTGQLTLGNVTKNNGGAYQCQADNGLGAPATAGITVNVQEGPSTVSITPRGPLALKEGTDFVLTCRAECTPDCGYLWSKDGLGVASEGGLLTLTGVSRDSEGAYTCKASNSVGTAEGQIQIQIQYGAGDSIAIIPDQDSMQVEEGHDLQVTCTATCNPPCQFRWLKKTSVYSTGPRLMIDSVTRSQSGVYTCIADNVAKLPAFRSTTLDVLYGPGESPDVFPGEPVQSVSRGASYQARCSDDCNPACQINWYFGSVALQTTNGILSLAEVKAQEAGQAGSYTCQAQNSVGVATKKIQLQVQAGPGTTITFSPPDTSQSAVEGRQYRVICSAECSPPCSFHWQRGDTNVSDSGELTFDRVTRTDAGVYICLGNNDLDSVSSRQLELQVTYGPEGSTRLIPDGNKTLDVGETLNLVCVADCFPPCIYVWFLGQREITSRDGELKVESVSLDDSGSYLCQANNNIGARETKSVAVFVQSGPGGTIKFSPPNDTVTLTEGNVLQVTCQADCTPGCFYTWTKGQQEILSRVGELRLAAVTSLDSGDYTCVAANGHGNQASKVLSLEVQYGPGESIELLPTGANQTVNEGASIQITCRSQCNPPCSHQWYFVTSPLTTSRGVLSLVSVTQTDQGNYKCVASNGLGRTAEQDVYITVQTGPGNTVRIDPAVQVYDVNQGEELRLGCSAVCSPPCTYTWYFGANRTGATDGELLKASATPADAGPYICYAANDVAIQGSQQIQVNVLFGPLDGVSLDPEEEQKVDLGNTVTLRCSSICNPPCQYRWFKGNREVYSQNGRLVVGPVTTESAGNYFCQAYNQVNMSTSRALSFGVLKPPGGSLRFVPANDNPTVAEFDDLTVTCVADCAPACEFVWRQGSREVPDSKGGVLKLERISRDDPTHYTCWASNGVGAATPRLLVLGVTYGPKSSLSIFPPEVTTTFGSDVSMSCKAKCNPECDLTWVKGQQSFLAPQGILTLSNVSSSDSGQYSCTATNSVGNHTGTVNVNIISTGGVRVQFEPPATSVTLPEGQTYTVTCTAACSPDCQFVWTKNEDVESSSSVLELSSVRPVDRGLYVCEASNWAGTNATQILSVDVTYGPASSLRLVPPMTNKRLAVGEPLLSRCEADCNPECDIVWLKDGKLLDGADNGNLFVPSVTNQESGVYTCQADNGIGQTDTIEMTVTVTFGPLDGSIVFVPPDRIRPVLEGDEFTVTCQAECLPACLYTWYVGNFKFQHNTGELTLTSVSRQDSGTYTCHTDNGVGPTRMLDLQLDVQYPPSTPELIPPTQTYQASEGSSLANVTCESVCNPDCDVSWGKDGQLYSQGRTLALSQIQTGQAGTYTCTASNLHGSSQSQIKVTVTYPPRISFFTLRDRKFSASVKENMAVSLVCLVSAVPAATISFYNGSQLIYSMDQVTELSYAWPLATCLDSGTYACAADNGVGDTATATVELTVLCSPRLDPRFFQQPLVAGQIGGTAVISVPVVGNPPPSFLWYKTKGPGVNEYIDANGEQEESQRFFYVNGTWSTLVIRNVQQDDFGDYVVSMVNTEGRATITFSLVAEGPPYKPHALAAIAVSDTTVQLQWIPGFNGGDPQQFVIEFRKFGSEEWRRIDRRIEDRQGKVQANVTDLQPSSRYTFRLRGQNRFGYSQFSDDAVVVTQDASEFKPQRSGDVSTAPVLLGVGLALGFLVGAGITAIVVVSRCRPKVAQQHGENTIDDYKSDTTYDTLYLKEALWAQRHIKLSNESFRSAVGPLVSYEPRQPEDTVRYYTDYGKSLERSSIHNCENSTGHLDIL